jgi:Rod binding domain-containing protein
MKIQSPLHSVTPGASIDAPIETVARDSSLTEEQKLGKLSGQFEAVLLRQILQNARKPVIHSKVNTETAPGGIYDDMVTNQLAGSISASHSLGLAETLQKQLTRQLLKPEGNSNESASGK